MPTRFAMLEERVSASVDRLHGELTRISPRVSGEFVRGAADPGRAVRDILGVIDFNPVSVRPQETGEYDGYRPEVDGEKVHISYTSGRLGTPVTLPRAGDVITALDRPGQPKFQIVIVLDDGLGRVVCRCVPTP